MGWKKGSGALGALEPLLGNWTARFLYWPAVDEGFHFAVEARTPGGWSRFVHHLYLPAG